ncbi:proline dehydrogenase family protein [Oceanithermus desulfurans]|uniref:proline dehydrogenase n=2 Tax=Oceanithermus desulfurans TaxID=227924 RepID=A0A511RMA6_9DEIN|nr:proline dehydrogenase family protein [Oceanithermus desulfurans]MBB6030988.1 proline dehydrogenase [Oceanithermus desulfurans]GEM90803.1 proline dehydrogenase [Oceanithermus desulfurans NBRC 100063]
MDLNPLYRSLVLGVAGQKWLERLVRTHGWRYARRYVAGHTLEEALDVVRELEDEGIHALVDLLGEMVTSEEEAAAFTGEIVRLVQALGELPYPRWVSVKLTQLGLDLGRELARDHLRRILDAAAAVDGVVQVDMEDSPRTDATLWVWRSLREEEGYENVGIVLQSYLKRSPADLQEILHLKPNLRVVKGAYKEPPEVAWQDQGTIRAQFLELVRTNLSAGGHTATGTHEAALVEEVRAWAEAEGTPRAQYEFQFLYGIRRELKRDLARRGYTVRDYLPYGEDWYPYFSRRLAERPENLLFVLRGMAQG